MKGLLVILGSLTALWATGQPRTISGTVRDAETRNPLPYATVQLENTAVGTTTNESGNFVLDIPEKNSSSALVVSFIGYAQQRIALEGLPRRVTISLAPDASVLQEVTVVSGTLKEVSKMDSPIPVEIYTPALFMKNPVPSIFESLNMINGVQPQLNCNVCNTGDIHINGMEGPYTMVLIDGMPIVSSLSTVYGLSGIPNSMVKRIEIVKGPASTLYGSEAVGGLINIITKDPLSSPMLKADISATTLREYNADVATKWRMGKAQALLGLNYFNFGNRIDINDDNFTDVTQQQRVSIFNKWSFSRRENRKASVAARYIFEDRWGGELQWTKRDRGSDQVYGESILTNRIEVLGNYQLPLRDEVLFEYSYNYHDQDSYYGDTPYLGEQHVAFAQLRWQKKVGAHDLLVGLPFRYVFYDDNTPGTASLSGGNSPMSTVLPGAFAQSESALNEKLTILTGLRWDHHNRHGNIFSPRLSFKFSPNNATTFRLSGGNGFRVVNLFTEDHAALTGAREVVIASALAPEESWNVNLNVARNIVHDGGYIGLDASVFYTYFTNKIVGDFMTDPERIIYDNLDGHAISRGITLNTDIAFTNGFKTIMGITLMDVFQKERAASGELERMEQFFAPKVSGTFSLSYAIDKRAISLDLTGRVNGPMRLPKGNPDVDDRPDYSPWFANINFQATKSFLNGLEIYAGVKNILNFIPERPLLEPENPFGTNFDTSYNYASVQGIKGFAGLRYTIQ